MQWPEKIQVLCNIYGTRHRERGPEGLNEAETTLLCISLFDAEMVGGCFWGFFHNSSGQFVSETRDALERIGAHKSASLLSRAIRIYFREHDVPRDAHERRRLLDEIDGDQTVEADRISDAFHEADEPPLDDLLLAYAQANRGRLRLMDDEAVTSKVLEGNWRQCTKCWDAWEQPPDEALAWCPACETLTLLRDGTSSAVV